MHKKIATVFAFFLLSSICSYGQNKKEQIKQLQSTIDSLKAAVENLNNKLINAGAEHTKLSNLYRSALDREQTNDSLAGTYERYLWTQHAMMDSMKKIIADSPVVKIHTHTIRKDYLALLKTNKISIPDSARQYFGFEPIIDYDLKTNSQIITQRKYPNITEFIFTTKYKEDNSLPFINGRLIERNTTDYPFLQLYKSMGTALIEEILVIPYGNKVIKLEYSGSDPEVGGKTQLRILQDGKLIKEIAIH